MALVKAQYEQMILNNLPRINSIESSLRSLTWFLPGRFQDSELASEALYSFLNMLSLYHSSLLERSLAASVSPTRPTASSHARYTHYWTTHSRAYALLARTLTLVSYTELLLEMTLRKRAGQPAANKLVLVLEVLKALARIGLLGITRRVGVNPPLGEREVDPAVLDGYVKSQAQTQVTRQGAGVPEPRRIAGVEVTPEIEATAQLERDLEAAALATAPTAAEYWQGSHTGLTRPTLASIRSAQDPLVGDPTTSATAGKDAVQAYLLSRVLTSEDVKSPRALMSKVGGVKTVAEMVWILRPLIYIYAMKKYGRRHTFPFLLSLALEYLSYSLRSQANAAAGKGKELSEVEKAENAKRFKAFWRYLVRGPVWDGFTKPKIEAFANLFEGKAGIGFVAILAKDYLPLIDAYHYYTNT